MKKRAENLFMNRRQRRPGKFSRQENRTNKHKDAGVRCAKMGNGSEELSIGFAASRTSHPSPATPASLQFGG